ncbi:hypothetical protein GCM10027168_29560 [Streptomyces capparidis]
MSDRPAPRSTASAHAEPESLAELVGDGARLAPRWPVPHRDQAAPSAAWDRIHGVRVPAASAHLVEGMSGYGG